MFAPVAIPFNFVLSDADMKPLVDVVAVVGLFDRSVYDPVNATVFKSVKNFFIFPNNVLSVSPLAIFTRVLASVNVGVCSFVETFSTLSKSKSDFVIVTSPFLPCTDVTLFTSAPSSMPFNLAVTSSIPA